MQDTLDALEPDIHSASDGGSTPLIDTRGFRFRFC